MTGQTLSDFVDRHGQEGAAKALGLSQAAISKALKARRVILIISSQDGGFEAAELKRFPSGGRRPFSAPDLQAWGIGNISADLEEIVPVASQPEQSSKPAVQTSSAEVAQ
ncbi:Cro/CI family transcriptional regulator [Pseudomonas nitroreducens]|uniref:Cro/CI family transcriptional regulator n=1 Tax=Pseudomonas nitroreducens TaxID=46680 RepID=UPI0028A62FFA|nr:Cro/CI family transcriptional regulator [Pseudomonas nitroreducens]